MLGFEAVLSASEPHCSSTYCGIRISDEFQIQWKRKSIWQGWGSNLDWLFEKLCPNPTAKILFLINCHNMLEKKAKRPFCVNDFSCMFKNMGKKIRECLSVDWPIVRVVHWLNLLGMHYSTVRKDSEPFFEKWIARIFDAQK